MKYPNAYSGVGKLLTSQYLFIGGLLLSVVSFVIIFFSGIISADSGLNVEALIKSIKPGGQFPIFPLIVMFAGLALFLASGIFYLIGVIKAMKDEASYKIALGFIIAGLVLSGINYFVSGMIVLRVILNILTAFADFVVAIYLIQGIRVISDKLNNGEVNSKGTKTFKLMIPIYLLILVSSLVSIFVPSISLIASIVNALLTLTVSVLLIGLFSKAKKMLA